MADDYTVRAAQAVLEAARSEHDFGGWLAQVLAAAAAELGSTDALTAGRPGSWEADLVQRLVKGTVGWDDEYLADHKMLSDNEGVAATENYGCELVVERFPRFWLQPAARGGEVEVRLELLPDPLATAWQAAGLTDPAVTSISITRTRGGDVDLHVVCDQASYLCGRLADAGVFDALRAAGLAFEASDHGSHEIRGQTYHWRRGTGEIEQLVRAAHRSASGDLPAP
jgi:hypothetical protein